MIETRDTKTRHKDHSQAWDIVYTLDRISPQAVVEVVTSTILLIMIIPQKNLHTILRETRKTKKFIVIIITRMKSSAVDI